MQFSDDWYDDKLVPDLLAESRNPLNLSGVSGKLTE